MADEILMDNAEEEAKSSANHVVPASDNPDERMEWWREARIGMFIHWGLYSVPGGIWEGKEIIGSYAEHIQLRGRIPITEYEQLADRFNPVEFNAEEWVMSAKEAGLKYLVVTAKHHDGFAMYDSRVSDFNIVARTPFKRDPLAELAEACKKQNIRFCVYYSHSMDWHHPDSQGNTWDYPGNIGAYDEVGDWIHDEDKHTRYEKYIDEFAIPQVKELLLQYDPGLIWFDCGHKLTEEMGMRFLKAVRETRPDCLVNRRIWREPMGDYGNTSDNQPHVRPPRRDWESVATMNQSWGYKKNDHNWRSPREILHDLINVVSLNGNYLINVGPTGEGRFDSTSLDILRQIGSWMKKNGSSIYGTQKSPVGKPVWGRCTCKANTLYLHVFDWPESGQLIVPGIRNRIATAYLLADTERKPLRAMRLNELDLLLQLPPHAADPFATVLAVEFEGELDTDPTRLLYPKDYDNTLSVFEGTLHGGPIRFDSGKKGRDVVLDWSHIENTVTWDIRVAEAGTYQVQLCYGSDASEAGGSYTVFIGDHMLSATVKHTGGMYRFETYRIGEVAFQDAGILQIVVKPDEITGKVLMNLKEIVLKRVD